MSEPVAGQQLDGYTLDRVVARSGMATLFEAHDVATRTRVAIKVPHPEAEADPALFERFAREAEIGLRMHHPGVVKVLANPGHTGVYIVMEWVDGQLLREILREPIAPERAVRITLGVCDALEYIHTHGVVHRDLKPENIMVDADDRIKLIDFGIAAQAGARRLTFANFSRTLGTPDYIAPEQVRGKRGDARTDVYALGVMLYEMLTGRVPFSGTNPFTVMNDRLKNDPVAPRKLRPQVSPALEEITLRALERDPIKRYHSALEMANDLRHPGEVKVTVRAAARRPGRRALWLYVGLAAIPLLLFALLLWAARGGH